MRDAGKPGRLGVCVGEDKRKVIIRHLSQSGVKERKVNEEEPELSEDRSAQRFHPVSGGCECVPACVPK